MSKIQVWLATAPDVETAKQIAGELVRGRHAACVNILPGAVSVYEWEGSIENDAECVMIIKAPRDGAEALKQAFVPLHPYDVPELIALDVTDGLPDYLKWVVEVTRLP